MIDPLPLWLRVVDRDCDRGREVRFDAPALFLDAPALLPALLDVRLDAPALFDAPAPFLDAPALLLAARLPFELVRFALELARFDAALLLVPEDFAREPLRLVELLLVDFVVAAISLLKLPLGRYLVTS